MDPSPPPLNSKLTKPELVEYVIAAKDDDPREHQEVDVVVEHPKLFFVVNLSRRNDEIHTDHTTNGDECFSHTPVSNGADGQHNQVQAGVIRFELLLVFMDHHRDEESWQENNRDAHKRVVVSCKLGSMQQEQDENQSRADQAQDEEFPDQSRSAADEEVQSHSQGHEEDHQPTSDAACLDAHRLLVFGDGLIEL